MRKTVAVGRAVCNVLSPSLHWELLYSATDVGEFTEGRGGGWGNGREFRPRPSRTDVVIAVIVMVSPANPVRGVRACQLRVLLVAGPGIVGFSGR